MPTYQYRCKECGHDFETVQAFTDDALTECPECKGALKKVYGNVGIAFKGSGFYKNDARSGGAKTKSGSTDTDSPSKTDAKAEKKTETKADTPEKKKSEKASGTSKTKSD